MVDYAGFEASIYFKQESTPGVTAAGQWKALAQKASVTIKDAPNPNFATKSGSKDFAKPTKGLTNPIATITLKPSTGSGKDFIKSFSTTDNFVSLLLVKIDTPSNFVFQRLVGCKVKRSNPSCQFGKQVELQLEIWAFDILYDEGTTPSYEAIPDTTLNWSDILIKSVADPSGTNPSRTTLTQWNSWEWTIENELLVNYDKDGNVTNIKSGERSGNGSISKVVTDNSSTEYGQAKAATPIDIEFLFSADSYVFNDCAYTEVSNKHELGSLAEKLLTFQAATLVIT